MTILMEVHSTMNEALVQFDERHGGIQRLTEHNVQHKVGENPFNTFANIYYRILFGVRNNGMRTPKMSPCGGLWFGNKQMDGIYTGDTVQFGFNMFYSNIISELYGNQKMFGSEYTFDEFIDAVQLMRRHCKKEIRAFGDMEGLKGRERIEMHIGLYKCVLNALFTQLISHSGIKDAADMVINTGRKRMLKLLDVIIEECDDVTILSINTDTILVKNNVDVDYVLPACNGVIMKSDDENYPVFGDKFKDATIIRGMRGGFIAGGHSYGGRLYLSERREARHKVKFAKWLGGAKYRNNDFDANMS